MSKIIGIVGSRRRNSYADYIICRSKFKEIYEEGDSIVSGGCKKGGDLFAEVIAKRYDIPIIVHLPNKNDLNKELLKINPRAAFAIINYARNDLIAQDADILIAIVAEDRKGGTEDTIKKAIKLGKQIILC